MFRAAPRLARTSGPRLCAAATFAPARRYLSTAPPAQKKRSWKSLAARIGIAGGFVYWWNERGADVFAEERSDVRATYDATDNTTLPTLESLSAERAARKAATTSHLAPHTQPSSTPPTTTTTATAPFPQSNPPTDPAAAADDPEHLESEANQQGAFNPETGEINWDCSCLGGMAHGPCGPEFREAFSCFVYSQAEPKGVDCVEKFKGMQNCFRQYPEVYGSELEVDGEDDDEFDELDVPSEDVDTLTSAEQHTAPAPATESAQQTPPRTPTTATSSVQPSSAPSATALSFDKAPRSTSLVPDNYKPSTSSDVQRANAAAKEVKSRNEASESETVVPKSTFDRREGDVDGGRKVEKRSS